MMYSFGPDNNLIELRETPYARELDLQDFLSHHPALLAGDQMDVTNPRAFVLVTAEAGSPSPKMPVTISRWTICSLTKTGFRRSSR